MSCIARGHTVHRSGHVGCRHFERLSRVESSLFVRNCSIESTQQSRPTVKDVTLRTSIYCLIFYSASMSGRPIPLILDHRHRRPITGPDQTSTAYLPGANEVCRGGPPAPPFHRRAQRRLDLPRTTAHTVPARVRSDRQASLVHLPWWAHPAAERHEMATRKELWPSPVKVAARIPADALPPGAYRLDAGLDGEREGGGGGGGR